MKGQTSEKSRIGKESHSDLHLFDVKLTCAMAFMGKKENMWFDISFGRSLNLSLPPMAEPGIYVLRGANI